MISLPCHSVNRENSPDPRRTYKTHPHHIRTGRVWAGREEPREASERDKEETCKYTAHTRGVRLYVEPASKAVPTFKANLVADEVEEFVPIDASPCVAEYVCRGAVVKPSQLPIEPRVLLITLHQTQREGGVADGVPSSCVWSSFTSMSPNLYLRGRSFASSLRTAAGISGCKISCLLLFVVSQQRLLLPQADEDSQLRKIP
jgi:hypothetical protein